MSTYCRVLQGEVRSGHVNFGGQAGSPGRGEHTWWARSVTQYGSHFTCHPRRGSCGGERRKRLREKGKARRGRRVVSGGKGRSGGVPARVLREYSRSEWGRSTHTQSSVKTWHSLSARRIRCRECCKCLTSRGRKGLTELRRTARVYSTPSGAAVLTEFKDCTAATHIYLAF